MDKKQAYERVTAEYERRAAADRRLTALRNKLGAETVTLKDAHNYVDRSAELFGQVFGRTVLDIAQGEREGTCTALMRDRVSDIDEVSESAQSAVLTRQGLNISPKSEAYPKKRIFTLAHSLEDPTATEEQITRRAESASATVMRSRFDENMKKGAKTCAEAGLKTYIVRDGSPKCCPWCGEIVGRYVYGSEPKDVYRRHDNCSCSVVYESGRGRQNVWSKQYWSAEQEREYLRLRDEMAPKRLNAKQAQALREQVGGLTGGANGGILNYRDSSITDYSVTPQIINNMPESAVFSGEIGERYNFECRNLLTHVMNSGAKAGTEFSIILDESMDRLEGHDYITGKDGHTIIEDADVFYHAFHNHGSDGMLSFSDLFNFSARSKQISISAVGNLGSNYILYTESRNQDEISKSKEKYFFYLWRQSTKPIVQTSTGEKITFRKIMNNADGIRTIIQNLPETEQRQILKEVVSKTEEHIREGEKYGFKYYERRV